MNHKEWYEVLSIEFADSECLSDSEQQEQRAELSEIESVERELVTGGEYLQATL